MSDQGAVFASAGAAGSAGPAPIDAGSFEESLGGHLAFLHDRLATIAPDVARIAMALYDRDEGILKTFINSTRSGYAIRGYEFPLAESISLSHLAQTRQTRVIDDIPSTLDADREHSRYVRDEGYLSSFTVPMHHQGQFLGFIFFDSRAHGTFTASLQQELVLYAQLMAVALASQLVAVRSIVGTIQVARDLAGLHDQETGAHQERMARYSRAIARQLIEPLDLTDEFVEALFLYAPMHDIGKIGVPDHILRKAGTLDPQEWEQMRLHPVKGRHMVDAIIADLGASALNRHDILVNVVEMHHELLDGSGYPHGLAGDQLPLEARIVTVADIFDALTSTRPYKAGWAAEDALGELGAMAEAGRLDPDCVAAMVASGDEILEIRARHLEIEEAIRHKVEG